MIESGWPYVWGAYGAVLVSLVGLILCTWRHSRRWARAERDLDASNERR
jgi:heme exporter protein CcmD